MANLVFGELSITTLAVCIAAISTLTLIYRKVVQEYQKYASLKALPGPPASSLLAGNLDKFFDPKQSVAWHGELTEKYGSAVRLTGTFGVRRPVPGRVTMILTNCTGTASIPV